MGVTHHSYGKIIFYYRIIMSSFGFLFPIYITLIGLVERPDRVKAILSSAESFLNYAVFLFIFWPFFLACALLAAYFFSDIKIDNDGLLVNFLWKELRVSWDQLIETRPLMGMSLPLFARRKYVVVLTKSLTPFHRLFGLLYGFSIRPAFVILPNIKDYDPLVEEINKHIKQKTR